MKEETHLLFESYLNQQLSDPERQEFEYQLKSNSDFAREFEVYKQVSSFLANKFSKEVKDFKQNLESISQQNFSTTQTKSAKVISMKTWYFSIAAAIVVFLGVLFVQYGNPVYSDYNQHEQAFFSERGNSDQNLLLAQDAFNSKKFKQATVFFEEILKTDKSAEIRFFYAISLLEENKFNMAENIFQELHKGSSIYKEKALWYLALSKLKQKKYEECRSILETIPSHTEDYQKAQQLLNDL